MTAKIIFGSFIFVVLILLLNCFASGFNIGLCIALLIYVLLFTFMMRGSQLARIIYGWLCIANSFAAVKSAWNSNLLPGLVVMFLALIFFALGVFILISPKSRELIRCLKKDPITAASPKQSDTAPQD